jgi:RNA polymerase sigma-B factor
MSTIDDTFVSAALADARTASPSERARVERMVVEHFLPAARTLASRYARRGVDLDDLEQVAALALLRALRRFDPDAGHLRGFVTACVLGEIKKHFRDLGWAVRPPRHIQDLQSVVADAMVAADETVHDRRRSAQAALVLGLDESTVTEVLEARSNFRALSLDQATQDGGPGLEARLGASDEDVAACDRRAQLRSWYAVLDDDDRGLLRMRFVDELSQREIAEHVGVTQKQVSRALARVLAVLRDRAGSDQAA